MKNMNLRSGFTNVRGVAFATFALATGFLLTKGVISASTPAAPKKAGLDNAMQQAHALMALMQADNFLVKNYPADLTRLPEQSHVSLKSRRKPESRSFVIPVTFDEYDEVAFICDTYVNWNPTYVDDKEALTSVTGFYIIGWKSGAVNTYDVSDVRVYRIPDAPSQMIPVFPGMAEYAQTQEPFIPTNRMTG